MTKFRICININWSFRVRQVVQSILARASTRRRNSASACKARFAVSPFRRFLEMFTNVRLRYSSRAIYGPCVKDAIVTSWLSDTVGHFLRVYPFPLDTRFRYLYYTEAHLEIYLFIFSNV